MKVLLLITLTLSTHLAASEGDYKKSRESCRTCRKLSDLVSKFGSESSNTQKVHLALDIAKEMKSIQLKNKSEEEKRREIYFAINSAIEILPTGYDFDYETVICLIDLRAQNPRTFDYVFWRFPRNQQEQIVQLMTMHKKDRNRPKAEIPVVKVIES